MQSSVNCTMEGSPPRMRGKGIADDEARAAVGITPACAGKSEKKVPFLPPHQDHPRVCGEKGALNATTTDEAGSPPRMRGKVPPMPLSRFQFGITPAYAGKRRCPRFHPGRIRDHPRVCGEKSPDSSCNISRTGSPPRMRGKGNLYLLDGVLDGITPAYAGKSLSRR